MFVQVIQGRTSQPEALVEAFDRWKADLLPGASGWLGSTGGITEDGRFIAVARFESEEAAMANSARPGQDAWWSETARLLDGEATFRNSSDVDADVHGDPDRAGFVQIMQGRGSDPERAKQLMAQDADKWGGVPTRRDRQRRDRPRPGCLHDGHVLHLRGRGPRG
jgi:hypothetical protein